MPTTGFQLDLFSSAAVPVALVEELPVFHKIEEEEPTPAAPARTLTHKPKTKAKVAQLPLITETAPAFAIAAEHYAHAQASPQRFAVKTSVAKARDLMYQAKSE